MRSLLLVVLAALLAASGLYGCRLMPAEPAGRHEPSPPVATTAPPDSANEPAQPAEPAAPPPEPGSATRPVWVADDSYHWAAAGVPGAVPLGFRDPHGVSALPMRPRVPVRGIYVSASSAATPAQFQRLFGLVRRTELNAMVIDAKGDHGRLAFVPRYVDLPEWAYRDTIRNFDELMAALKEAGVYTIARIVVFRDPVAGEMMPEWAVQSTAGGQWRDRHRNTWLNPYMPQTWDYNLAMAREAALRGFDEIQFDYVRFPTDGQMGAVYYPGQDERDKAAVIAGFLSRARKELNAIGVWTSADVFGLVTTFADDMGIGQHLETLAYTMDYISPMVYPSHYQAYNLGLPDPESDPYETVLRSMHDARGRLHAVGDTEMIIRPWLQDFSMRVPYGPDKVRAQIQAVYDADLAEWMLWNAGNIYSEEALLPAVTTARP